MNSNNLPAPPAARRSRREFLVATATAASAAAAGTLDASRFANAAGSDILRVGLIGCGGRNAGAAVQALTADPGARLVAMGDIFLSRIEDKLKMIREKRGAQVQVDREHCFTGFDAYRRVIESSDVVLIANAAKFHPLHTRSAIEAGRHVFVEKPHGIDPAGAHAMQAACELARTKGLCVVSGLQSRHHEGYAETVRRIHAGAIGDVVAIEENFLRGPYGVVERQPGLSELEWQCSTQYHFPWLSGDDVPQSLSHNLDRSSWVLRDATPIKCHGLGGRSSMHEPIYGAVFDHHSVVYEFASGARVYAFCRTTTGCHNESSSIIFGTKGRASLLQSRIWGENEWRWQGTCNPYQVEHDRLFASIRSGRPINNGDYMVRSALITTMGQLSCYTGREITWEQINRSRFHYPPRPEDCRDGMAPPVTPGADGSYPVFVPGRSQLAV